MCCRCIYQALLIVFVYVCMFMCGYHPDNMAEIRFSSMLANFYVFLFFFSFFCLMFFMEKQGTGCSLEWDHPGIQKHI